MSNLNSAPAWAPTCPPATSYRKPPATRAPKGHDAVIGALQESRRTATIALLSGERVVGTIVSRDKFTITLLSEGRRLVIYKHAIEFFFGEESAAPRS